jgi:hypothetical protein
MQVDFVVAAGAARLGRVETEGSGLSGFLGRLLLR